MSVDQNQRQPKLPEPRVTASSSVAAPFLATAEMGGRNGSVLPSAVALRSSLRKEAEEDEEDKAKRHECSAR